MCHIHPKGKQVTLPFVWRKMVYNSPLYYLSSCHDPAGDMTTQRRAKNGTVQELQCTPTVEAYAKYMAGVEVLLELQHRGTEHFSHIMVVLLRLQGLSLIDTPG
jgi:hypothetical protein